MVDLRNKFANIYPSLDLHGEKPDLIFVLIDGFIKDNLKLGKKIIVIVHGKGTGAVKEETHRILKKHPNVVQYYLDVSNIGQTLVELKENVKH